MRSPMQIGAVSDWRTAFGDQFWRILCAREVDHVGEIAVRGPHAPHAGVDISRHHLDQRSPRFPHKYVNMTYYVDVTHTLTAE